MKFTRAGHEMCVQGNRTPEPKFAETRVEGATDFQPGAPAVAGTAEMRVFFCGITLRTLSQERWLALTVPGASSAFTAISWAREQGVTAFWVYRPSDGAASPHWPWKQIGG